MQSKVKSQITCKAAMCLTGQAIAYLQLGSTVWINGQFVDKTQSILPGTFLLVFFALGLLVSKQVLLVACPRKVYFVTSLLSAIAFFIYTRVDSIVYFVLLSVIMGLCTGIAYFAPVLKSQMHLPDRSSLISTIVLIATAVGFSVCVLMPVNAIAIFYLSCSVLGSILMGDPDKGLYRLNDFERLKLLLLNQRKTQSDFNLFKSAQLWNITLVASLTNLLPVCCLMGFQQLLHPEDPYYCKMMASIWMMANLVARILSRYVSLLGEKRTVLLFLILLQYTGLALYRFKVFGIYWCFFISAVTSGFVQTLLPMMMIDIYRDQAWLYEKLSYPLALVVSSITAAFLLQWKIPVVYLWCMLATSLGFGLLSLGNFRRYVSPITNQQKMPQSVLDQ